MDAIISGAYTQELKSPIQAIEETLVENLCGDDTKEPAPPVQTIEEPLDGNVGGVTTKEPTPPSQMNVELWKKQGSQSTLLHKNQFLLLSRRKIWKKHG